MLARPKSVGTVTLMSKNPFDPPVLDHNSLSHPDDFELMVKAAKASRRLGNAKIFRRALGAEPITKVSLHIYNKRDIETSLEC
ncbi:hypothetical protein HAZT_HAZT003956 [Hyalella azteca]|uniref:Glucose-methanol-choline oxidoreductase C-terminal domain-containing protein n=1 Tax=Hyalella azteca TaxID=294128 RepID=A0A6A0GYT0_HYAAZ|nr:hypothetical protein HAZT_HAZT003956 [Hyalella azteca]